MSRGGRSYTASEMDDPLHLPPGTFRIAHLSDVHFGKIAHPAVVGAIIGDVSGGDVGLVAVSGDLTQRARIREFAAARSMIDAFTAPVIVVPGNHDVRAWWHAPVSRVWRSTSRFRRLITEERVPSVTAGPPEARVVAVGINSAHGLTIKGGRIRRRDLEAMEARFALEPPGTFRVLVVHHHLLQLEALGDHDVSRGARRALDAARRARVDLVLCGHLHRSHVARIELAPPSAADGDGHRLVVATAGTATSSRGREENAGANLYNWISVGPTTFTVEERRFDAGAETFHTERTTTFERDRVPTP